MSAVRSGWLWGDRFSEFLAPVLPLRGHEQHSAGLETLLMAVSILAAAAGIALAYVFYVRSPEIPGRLTARLRGLYDTLLNKYWIDEVYGATVVGGTFWLANALWRFVDATLIDGTVNGVGKVIQLQSSLWRRVQTGNVQHYALTFLGGVILVIGYFLLH